MDKIYKNKLWDEIIITSQKIDFLAQQPKKSLNQNDKSR